MEKENTGNETGISQEEAAGRIAGMKILIVEDNELNLEILQEVLEEKGVLVTAAANGQIAVDLFESSRPGAFDAVFMDMHMPVLDGVSATKQIRAMERPDAKTIPILALTANDFEEDVRRTREAGMNDHLTKPFDMEQIIRVLAEYAVRNCE